MVGVPWFVMANPIDIPSLAKYSRRMSFHVHIDQFARTARSALLATALVAALPAWANLSDPLGSFLQSQDLLQTEPAIDAASPSLSQLVVHAMGFLGVPYRMGGQGFDEGVDCSAFVRIVYQDSLGLRLPRAAREQAEQTTTIQAAQIQPGDLVFFNTLNRPFSHVGIYVGEGRFIHSPRSGAAVRVEDMGKPYWQARFEGARRVTTGLARTRL